jgi:hypothetical protein
MNYNGDFKYDLVVGQLGESLIGNLLSNETIEVKFDFGTCRTDNFYIEYESRGVPSGIATTKAKYWILIASSEHGQRLKSSNEEMNSSDILYAILISTDRLKKLCREDYFRKGVKGGDNNTSIGVLIKSSVLIKNGN